MTSRERMLTALRNGQPDRVPVAPDISNMIPCRLTNKPFWEIYVNENPPLWKAYLEAVKYFGMDAWFVYGDLHYKTDPKVEITRKIIKSSELWKVQRIYHTPDGDLKEVMACPKYNPPTPVEKLVKNFKEDFRKFKHFYPKIIGYNDSTFQQQKRELGELGIMCFSVETPGLHVYLWYFNGSLEAATYAFYDYPDLFEELREINERHILKRVEIAIDAGTDSILTGGSGSITNQSPDIWRQLSLPTLKKITKMCKQAGIISGVHSCGKERYMVEVCAHETDLDYIHPLEVAPMGDCDLAECKKLFGNRISLMGNLHTIETMWRGNSEDVKRESLKAIMAAGLGGGFVLSTGDQCGMYTPDENIFTMVKVAKMFGHYPLNIEKIESEIKRLER